MASMGSIVAKIHKALGQHRSARLAAFLLLFAGWFATAALGACLSHSSANHALQPHSEMSGASAVYGAGDAENACCLSSLDGPYHPALVKAAPPADPGPAALPDLPVAPLATATPGARVVPGDIDAELNYPPFYLLYSRLLIPSFS